MVSACKVLQCSRIFKRSDLLVARQLVGVLNLSNTDIPFQSSLQFLVLCSMPLAGTPVNFKRMSILGSRCYRCIYVCLFLAMIFLHFARSVWTCGTKLSIPCLQNRTTACVSRFEERLLQHATFKVNHNDNVAEKASGLVISTHSRCFTCPKLCPLPCHMMPSIALCPMPSFRHELQTRPACWRFQSSFQVVFASGHASVLHLKKFNCIFQPIKPYFAQLVAMQGKDKYSQIGPIMFKSAKW